MFSNYRIYFRFIPDPFIDGLRSELSEMDTRKREEVEKARAEKAAKGKLK